MSNRSIISSQPKVQTAAQRLDYLLRKRKTAVRKTKSRFEVFAYWLESDKSAVDVISTSTSLKDISITARRLLLSSPYEEPHDGKQLLLSWSKPPKAPKTPEKMRPIRSRSKRNMVNNNDKKLQLTESIMEIEAWLFSVAVYILWKRESKCNEALVLCSRAIGIASSHVSDIATMSPRSHIDREENDDKKSSLKLLISNLKNYETLISQECVKSLMVESEGNAEVNEDVHKQRIQSLHRRMEFNKKRLESLNTRLDFKANMINFNLIDLAGNSDDEDDSTAYTLSTESISTKETMSNILYPHLVFHPYFNSY